MTVILIQNSPLANHFQSKPGRANSAVPSRRSAMRYYRLWIYTCNAVLLVCVLGFVAVAGRVVFADSRRYLVPGLALYQPSFLYAYLALATQSGILQLIGTLGAIRLNEKLLNAYWLLLLVLLFGDAIVGIVWVFRFDKIVSELKPSLKQRLDSEYGVDPEFTALWDSLQRNSKCCGVDGPQDFVSENRSTDSEWMSTSESILYNAVPESCCRLTEKRPIAMAIRMYNLPPPPTPSPPSEVLNLTSRVPTTKYPPSASQLTCNEPDGFQHDGCTDVLLQWLRQSADVLFVLGYCVIAFIKLCFLGILRYEIREMIQKIKVLQGELRPPTLLLTDIESGGNNPSAPGPTTTALNSPTSPHLQPLLLNHKDNGDIINTDIGFSSKDVATHKPVEKVLLQPPDAFQATPIHSTAAHQRHIAIINDGNDSDTNSNCALIISEEPSSTTSNKQNRNSNGNNNSYELQELNRLLARHQSQI